MSSEHEHSSFITSSAIEVSGIPTFKMGVSCMLHLYQSHISSGCFQPNQKLHIRKQIKTTRWHQQPLNVSALYKQNEFFQVWHASTAFWLLRKQFKKESHLHRSVKLKILGSQQTLWVLQYDLWHLCYTSHKLLHNSSSRPISGCLLYQSPLSQIKSRVPRSRKIVLMLNFRAWIRENFLWGTNLAIQPV